MYSLRRLLEVGAAAARRRRNVTLFPKAAKARAVPLNVTIAPPTPGGGGLPAWPATYYTGPLGTNNIVPSALDGALLILAYDDVRGLTTPQKRANIQQRMADCGGQAFDGLTIHYGGIETPGTSTPTDRETWIHSVGSISVVYWVPNRLTRGAANDNTMVEINNGLHDSQYTNAANYWKNLGFRVMVRMFWEFDGNWFPWSPTANANANDGAPNPGCTAAQWISAWRRIIGLFQAAGASNVGFWWCPTESNNGPVASSCYPGDAYVDWVGSDCYNQATSTVQTSPLHAGWAEFWELFNFTGHGSTAVCKHDEFGPRKPYVVGETSSLYDATDVNRKANWFRNIYQHANAKPDMPYLCGVQIFDENLAPNVEKFDWRVDSNQTFAMTGSSTPGNADPATYQGFKDWAAQVTWNRGAVGGAT